MARNTHRTYPDLTAYMEATGENQTQVAAKLGRSQAFISKLRRGLLQPSLDEALRISRLLGIPVESFVIRTGNILDGKS